MAGKSPDGHWKISDYNMSGQLTMLDSNQPEFVKTFNGLLADYVKNHLAQKKTVSAEKTNQYFIDTYDELKKNKKTAVVTIKQKYFDNLDNKLKLILEEKVTFSIGI